MNERTHRYDGDFETMSWHDNTIYGVDLVSNGETSELRLDIDYLLEWVCGRLGRARFWVAPAALVFEHVTDLSIRIDAMTSAHQVAIVLPTISQVYREAIEDQRVCLDRPYYRWHIDLCAPGGELTFGASGFRQQLRREAVLTDEQHYPGDR
jgi:hypothetical protein